MPAHRLCRKGRAFKTLKNCFCLSFQRPKDICAMVGFCSSVKSVPLQPLVPAQVVHEVKMEIVEVRWAFCTFLFALVYQTKRWKRWAFLHRIIQVSQHINSWPFLVSDADWWSRKADWFVQTAEPTLNQSYKVMLQDWKRNSCSSSREWRLQCEFSVWVLFFVRCNILISFKNGAALCMCRWGIRKCWSSEFEEAPWPLQRLFLQSRGCSQF